MFVTVRIADPKHSLSDAQYDENGNVLATGVSSDSIKLPENLHIAGQVVNGTLSNALTAIDTTLGSIQGEVGILRTDVFGLNAKADEVAERIAEIEAVNAANSLELANAQEVAQRALQNTDGLNTSVASNSATISNINTRLDDILTRINSNASGSGITDPETLFSDEEQEETELGSGSNADLADEIAAYSVTVSDSLRSFGATYLGDTTIAGAVTVTGSTYLGDTNVLGAFTVGSSFSISQNAINVEGTPFSDQEEPVDGILFLQNSPLANKLDIFNGAVTIAKDGTIKTTGSVEVNGNLQIDGAITITATAGETIKAKDALYISAAGVVKKADSTNPNESAIVGIAANNALLGEKVLVIVGGKAKGFTTLEVGKKYYLGTNGLITPTPPALSESVPVGVAFSSNELVVQLGN